MRFRKINEIKGLEYLKGYSVDDAGNVYSHYKRYNHENIIQLQPSRKLKLAITEKGYLKVKLKEKSFFVHRLVAMAFINNKYNKPQVNHIDGNKQNNNVNNLEWVTNSENHKHKCENGLNVSLSGDNHYTHKRNYKDGEHHSCHWVGQYTLDGKLIKIFKSVKTAGKEIGRHYTTIIKAIDQENKTAGGYKWKTYKEGSTTIRKSRSRHKRVEMGSSSVSLDEDIV